METKDTNKRTFFQGIGNLLYADYLFKKEMVNKKHCYHLMQREEMHICKYTAIVILILEIIIGIRSLINTSQIFDHQGLYLVARITLLLITVAMIFVAFFIILLLLRGSRLA